MKIKKEGSHARALRHRWITTSTLVVAIVLGVAILAFSIFIVNYYYTAVRTGLETKAKTATDFFANYITKTEAEYYDSASRYTEYFNDRGKIELQFLDTSGTVIVSTYGIVAGTRPGSEDIINALETGVMSCWIGRRSHTEERIMSVSAPMIYSDGNVIGVMRYVTSMRYVDRQVSITILVACILAIIVLLVVIVINMVFIRSVIEPVGEITVTAKRIAEGSYGIQMEQKYRDEIGDMVEAINEMSLKIAQSEKVQTEFISSVSHELRTPLTAITGWGETLIVNDDLSGDTRRGIAIILKEAHRLTKMVEELLEFTRMEDGRFTLNIEQIDIAAELEDSIYTYREILQHDNLSLVYDPYPDELPLIPGDPSRLKQVFLNIFDNAAKYASNGGKIEISVSRENSFVCIKIRDFGPGVPEDELDHVKMKFYKGSNAKGRGSGIGLAVCDEIIKYHGGSIKLENAEGGGLLITIRLPMSTSV